MYLLKIGFSRITSANLTYLDKLYIMYDSVHWSRDPAACYFGSVCHLHNRIVNW